MLSDYKVKDLMVDLDQVKSVSANDIFRTAIECLNNNKWGIVPIVNGDQKLLGVITDGDVRRVLLKTQDPLPKLFSDVVEKYMTVEPKTVMPETDVTESLKMLSRHLIAVLPVVDSNKKLLGVIHVQHALNKLLEISPTL